MDGYKTNIFICDNASNESLEPIKKYNTSLMLIQNKTNVGFAKAINQVANRTRSKYVLLLNPDAVISEDIFNSAIPYMESHPEIGVLGPKILDRDGSIQGSARSFPTFHTALFGRSSFITKLFPNNPLTCTNVLTHCSDGQSPMEVDWVSGACMLLRRKAFDDAGLFDENFFLYWEDADLCKRMWKKGWKVVYFPEALTMHYVGASSENNIIRSIFEFHKSAFYYYRKHYKNDHLLLKFLVFFGLIARFYSVICFKSLLKLFRTISNTPDPIVLDDINVKKFLK